ncbi:aquaporin [Pacificibacter marinus]|uniref:Aquaporin Z 2 n=1 Tax=Pacificibacter marinus TaxID=658057 RepID=A0A1Y5STP8_9RHOB|nr:aquaporin [Pacificibacter marinus]SEK83133.1 aquaporin Z [Pacificibacter marinus]SLN48246.1 Aquaporin Z 2 [Pacificibacter marinus]
MSRKLIAEALGTFILVFFGCGAAVFMGAHIGMMGIALAFGLSIVAAAYGLGAISGAHLNPAVSLGMVTAGRMSVKDFVGYAIAQVIGATIAAFVIMVIAKGAPDYSVVQNGLGQNGFGAGYLGEYTIAAALIFEIVATFVFVTVILGATQDGAPAAFAGLAIGLTLTAIHLVGINITGVSVNPARSFGPAVFVGGKALADLWVFIVAPLAGGAFAGVIHAMGITRADV